MPVFKNWLINADWTQGAATILNEQLWVMTSFFFSASENVYLVRVWNKDLQEQTEQLKLWLLSTSHPMKGMISCGNQLHQRFLWLVLALVPLTLTGQYFRGQLVTTR